MPEHYQKLLATYTRTGLDNIDELVDLFQFLLDTDLILEMSPKMQQFAQYMVMEGFCYDIQP